MQSKQRAMTEQERAHLRESLRNAPSLWKLGIGNSVPVWAVSMFGFLALWTLIAWASNALFALHIGWRSSYALWILAAGALACAALAIASTLRWLKSSGEYRSLAQADLDNGVVMDEHLEFLAAKRFQEPEHGGLMYLALTTDNRVFTLYDHESQRLGLTGRDPLTSSFQPSTQLRIVRAPLTRFAIAKTISGVPLVADIAGELTVPPEQWPEPDEFCDIPWHELERRFSRQD
jgi:hypothetical protein